MMDSKKNPSKCKRHSSATSQQEVDRQKRDQREEPGPDCMKARETTSQMQKALEAQNEALSAQVSKLTLQNSKLKRELASARSATQLKAETHQLPKKQSVLKGQLEQVNKLYTKTKKELQMLKTQYQEAVKRGDEFKGKLNSSEKEIGALKTVHSSKGFILNPKAPKSPQPEPKLDQIPIVEPQAEIMRLREQIKVLGRRIGIYQEQRTSAELAFEPIIRCNNQQIRELIQQKNSILTRNAEMARTHDDLQCQNDDLKSKNVRLIQIVNKLQKEDQSRVKNKQVQQASDQEQALSHYEQVLANKELQIAQLSSLFENARSHIHHLENTSRYLASQNKKLMNG